MAEILRAWDPDLSVLIGCAALLAAYWSAHRGDRARARWFVAGVAVMLFALIASRRHFYRKASLFNEGFGPGWIAAILLVPALLLVLQIIGEQFLQVIGVVIDALLAVAEVGGHLAVAGLLEQEGARRSRLEYPQVALAADAAVEDDA